jgi:hypothetical protein
MNLFLLPIILLVFTQVIKKQDVLAWSWGPDQLQGLPSDAHVLHEPDQHFSRTVHGVLVLLDATKYPTRVVWADELGLC